MRKLLLSGAAFGVLGMPATAADVAPAYKIPAVGGTFSPPNMFPIRHKPGWRSTMPYKPTDPLTDPTRQPELQRLNLEQNRSGGTRGPG
jgi:hypothetical protein